MQELLKVQAGNWPNTGGNSNLIPVVANGEVFVASYQQLQIFGIKSAAGNAAKSPAKK
jgi:streptogramin lyase